MDHKRAMDQELEGKIETEAKVLLQSCNNQAQSSSSSSTAPPYVIKIYDMVEDPSTDSMISWSKARNSFIVWDSHQFSTTLLPKFFKTKNFPSFVRQLHTYGFRKVDLDRLEFAHEGFLGGQKHLLMTIKRQTNASRGMQPKGEGPCVELGNDSIEGELERLGTDKNMLMAEVVKLGEQQQESKNLIIEMEKRIEDMDSKQQYLMDFLSKSSSNPAFIQQYLEILKAKLDPQEIESGRKRRLTPSPDRDHLQDQASYYASQQQDTSVDAKTDMESSSSAVDKSVENISSPKVSTHDEYPDVFNEYIWDELLDKDLRTVNEEGVVVGYQPGVEVDDPANS